MGSTIRLLAFDLDGTTLTEHKYISRENLEALRLAGERGVELVPASGRMRTFLPEEILSLPGVRYAVTANGAGVYDLRTGEAVFRALVSNEKAKQVQRLLDGYDIYIEYYENGKAITRRGYPEAAVARFGMPESKLHFFTKDYELTYDFSAMLEEKKLCPEKINLPYLQDGLREEVWKKLEALGGLKLTSSIPDNIEINAAEADKGNGLRALCDFLSVAPEEVMSAGDNGNDVSMLAFAGCSVAMGDASAEALEAAKHVTGKHTESGLAMAIHRWILD